MKKFKKAILPVALSISVIGLAGCSSGGTKYISSKAGDVTEKDIVESIGANQLSKAATSMMIQKVLLDKYKNITPKSDAKINTETPAWAVDRLSILALKVYHMSLEANRESASEEHRQNCQAKLDVLLTQKEDLSTSIIQLLTDIENGDVKMKVYKQMKMYNDESLNPILYQKEQKWDDYFFLEYYFY